MTHEPLRALGAAATDVLRRIGIETTPEASASPVDAPLVPQLPERRCWFCDAAAGPEVTLVTPGAQVVWNICQTCTKDAVGSLILTGALTIADLLDACHAVIQSVREGTEERARAQLATLDAIAAQCTRDTEGFLAQTRANDDARHATEPERSVRRMEPKHGSP